MLFRNGPIFDNRLSMLHKFDIIRHYLNWKIWLVGHRLHKHNWIVDIFHKFEDSNSKDCNSQFFFALLEARPLAWLDQVFAYRATTP